MGSLSQAVRWIWAVSILGQLAVPGLLFAKGNYRKLPLFTSCALLNLSQAALTLFLYSNLQTYRDALTSVIWNSENVILLARAAATTEVLALSLKPYPGIWGLSWRALSATSGVVVLLIAWATRGHWKYAKWFELDRGYYVTLATALIAVLLLIRYYSIPVPNAYKMILAGFCFFSCTQILIYTVLQALFYRHFPAYEPLWQFATILSFVIVQAMWIAALWHRLPDPPKRALAGDQDGDSNSNYNRLSPKINEELTRLNDKLKRLWKLEESSS